MLPAGGGQPGVELFHVHIDLMACPVHRRFAHRHHGQHQDGFRLEMCADGGQQCFIIAETIGRGSPAPRLLMPHISTTVLGCGSPMAETSWVTSAILARDKPQLRTAQPPANKSYQPPNSISLSPASTINGRGSCQGDESFSFFFRQRPFPIFILDGGQLADEPVVNARRGPAEQPHGQQPAGSQNHWFPRHPQVILENGFN